MMNKPASPYYDIKMLANGEAEITIYDVIGGSFFSDGVTGKQFVEDLKNLPAHKVLNIYINSPGGSVYEGRLIFNALKRHPAYKKVIIDGLAASMASGIAMVGDEIIMPENAMMMIHDPAMGIFGNAVAMREGADYLDKSKTALISAYRDKSGLSDEKIAELMTAETWMTAKEAIELGFANKMTDAVEVTNLANFDLSLFRKVPQLHLFTREQNKGDSPVEINLDKIKSDYPSIAEALRNEGKSQAESNLTDKLNSARQEAAEAERKRIQDVENQAMPGHETLINELKFDGKTTGPEAAVKVLAAEKAKGSKYLENIKKDAPEAAPKIVDATETASKKPTEANADETDEDTDARCKANWEKDSGLKDEFLTLAAYTAFEKNNKKSLIKFRRSSKD